MKGSFPRTIQDGPAIIDRDFTVSKARMEAASSIVTSYLIQILNVGTGIFLANILAPSERGTLAAAVLLPPAILAIASFGLPESVTHHFARRTAPDRELLSASLAVAGIAGLGAAIMSASLAGALYPSYSHSAFYIYAAFPAISAITGVAIQSLLGLGRIRSYNLARLTIQAITLALLLMGACFTPFSASGVAAIYLIAELATAIIAWSMLRIAPTCRVRLSVVRPLLSFGWKASLGIAATVVIERGDQLVLAQRLSAAELGLYAVASSVAGSVLIIGASIGQLALRRIPAARTADRQRMVLRSTGATLFASLLAAAVVAAASPRLIPVLMGESYVKSVAIAQILCGGAIFIGVNRVLSGGLKGMGRSIAVGVTQIIGAVVTLSLIPYSIDWWGLHGAAAAILGGSAATMIVLIVLVLTDRPSDSDIDIARPGTPAIQSSH